MHIEDYISDKIAVRNIQVYGLENSIRVSKFPMAIDADKPTIELTKRVESLGSCIPGSGHDCFLKGIIFQCDLTLPQYIWQQIKRYSHFDIVSSQSTMHKILEMDIRNSITSDVDVRVLELLIELIDEYKKETDPIWKKAIYDRIIANIPSGLKLAAGISTNYLQLKTIRTQRHNHKMNDWKELCTVIDGLPMFKELVLGG